jgi:hypothetical protein
MDPCRNFGLQRLVMTESEEVLQNYNERIAKDTGSHVW